MIENWTPVNTKQAIKHELAENKRQLAVHLAKPVPTEHNDLNMYVNEQARLELTIHVYQQALDEQTAKEGDV